MHTWHVYGVPDDSVGGEIELLGAILAENIYTAIGAADERFPYDRIDEVTLAGHGRSAPVRQNH